jgi:hypothetical protein
MSFIGPQAVVGGCKNRYDTIKAAYRRTSLLYRIFDMDKFTALFQYSHKTMDREKEWFEELFSSFIGEEIHDGEHKIVCDDVILIDAFIHANDPEYYKRFKGKNAILMHFADEFYEGHYEIYQNFKGVVRTHWSGVFNPAYVKQIPSGYVKGMDRTLEIPLASARPFVWSFAGELNKSSRLDMAGAFARIEPHYLFAFDSHVPGYDFRAGVFPERLGDGIVPIIADAAKPMGMTRTQYQRTLLDAIFSPSPMGSATIEGGRTYDALENGSIPIVERRLGLDYYREVLGPHPLPTVRSWPEARDLVRTLLRDPNRLDALQAECTSWWAQKKATLRDEVGAFIKARSADPVATGERPMVEPKANSGIWRLTELARHHDLRAGGRRAARIAARVLQGKRARAAVAAFKPNTPH